MLVFLLTFYCFFYNCTKVIADRFYIFDVGKGNCQLAIFEEEGIGILYDCGSSSGKKPAKFLSTITEGSWYKIYQKQTENQDIPTHRVSEENLNSIDEELKDSESKENSKFDGNSTENEDSPSMSTSFFDDNVKPSIVRHLSSLNHLFIILSHPEQDHINLINLETIPQAIPIMVLCEGDWFGHNTKEVKEVLNFLKERPNTCIDFPFYWKGLQGINEKVSYKKLLDTFRQDDNDFTKTLELYEGKSVISEICFRSLYEILLNQYLNEKVYFPLFKKMENDYCNNVFVKVLKSIKIAHVNFPFNDINSQSAIVEIKIPKLEMQFF